MKTKYLVLGLIIASAVSFYSFKKMGENESTQIALVCSAFSRDENAEGFLISYGDGSMELKKFDFKAKAENFLQQISVVAVIMNEMHAKGYRFVGNGQHQPYELTPMQQYMVFEKR